MGRRKCLGSPQCAVPSHLLPAYRRYEERRDSDTQREHDHARHLAVGETVILLTSPLHHY